MINLGKLQRDMYLAQRGLGDLRALQRGPDVLAKRLVRRRATRGGFQLLRSLTRGMNR